MDAREIRADQAAHQGVADQLTSYVELVRQLEWQVTVAQERAKSAEDALVRARREHVIRLDESERRTAVARQTIDSLQGQVHVRGVEIERLRPFEERVTELESGGCHYVTAATYERFCAWEASEKPLDGTAGVQLPVGVSARQYIKQLEGRVAHLQACEGTADELLRQVDRLKGSRDKGLARERAAGEREQNLRSERDGQNHIIENLRHTLEQERRLSESRFNKNNELVLRIEELEGQLALGPVTYLQPSDGYMVKTVDPTEPTVEERLAKVEQLVNEIGGNMPMNFMDKWVKLTDCARTAGWVF